MRAKNGAVLVPRRTLLTMAAAGAAGIWVGRLSPPAKAARQTGQNVVVLGGGLAGLIAAYELGRLGHEVVVLEIQNRAGGRVFSSGEGLIQGQIAELGATRIPDIHDLTRHYAREFDLTLDVFPPSRTNYLVSGRAFLQPGPGEPWPLNFTPLEQEFGPAYPERILNETSPAWALAQLPGWPPPDLARRFDASTMVSWLRRIGAGRDMVNLYTAAGGSRGSVVGELMVGAQEILLQGATSYAHIRGGNENLPRSIASALGPSVRYGTTVTAIERNQRFITVSAQDESGPISFQADHVISALPPTILRTIPILPALPALSARAIAQVDLSAAWKTIIQTRTRFWNEMGMQGLVIAGTDTPAERVWDVSSVEPGSCGLLHQYITNHQSAFDGTTASQRRRMVTAYLAPVLPQLKDPSEVLSWREFHWEDQPWVRGGIAGILPNQAWMFRVLPQPVGRLHFAGDHTSIWAGWMQGAIQSGLRAAQEIDAAVGYEIAA